MSILNVNGVDIEEQARASKVVELMLKKPMAITSKGELARLVIAQYSAIEALLQALEEASPGHPLLPRHNSQPL
jgi:hypothetical protein